MNRRDLVPRMLELLPDLRQSYDALVEWYHGEDPGLHVIFGDVLDPYLVESLAGDVERPTLVVAFGLLEEMATSVDPYVQEVLAVTVLERLGDDRTVLQRARRYMGPATRQLSDEVEAGWGRQDDKQDGT